MEGAARALAWALRRNAGLARPRYWQSSRATGVLPSMHLQELGLYVAGHGAEDHAYAARPPRIALQNVDFNPSLRRVFAVLHLLDDAIPDIGPYRLISRISTKTLKDIKDLQDPDPLLASEHEFFAHSVSDLRNRFVELCRRYQGRLYTASATAN